MSVRVKLDEPLSERLIGALSQRLYDVATVRGQGWGGLKDPELWPLIVAEGRFFITTDKGFGDTRRYVPGSHPGILVLRPERESLLAYAALLDWVLERFPLEELVGTVAVATPQRLRVRRPPR